MNGYVFDVHIQKAKCLLPVIFPLYFLFLVILWVETAKHRFAFAFVLFATLWTLLIVWILYCQIKLAGLHNLRFSCKNKEIINYCNLGECIVSAEKTFYCTTITQCFGYGKATLMKTFYLFSENPFSREIPYGKGLFTFKNLWTQKVVVIPKNHETQEWLKEIMQIKMPPQYPKVSCYIKHSSTKRST